MFELQLIRCEVVVGKAGNALNRLAVPDALEFQVVDRHDGFDSPIEFICLETLVQVNRNETGLPVVAVDEVRAETDGR